MGFTTRGFQNRRWLGATVAGVAGLVLIGAGITVAIIAGGPSPAPARARQYTAAQACLLTGSRGITSPQAAPVWAGMEDASLDTHAKVSYLPAYGPANSGNTARYASSLVQRHCDVILAVGTAPVQAIKRIAPRTPKTRFIVIGGTPTIAPGSNFTTTTGTRGQVKQVLEELIGS